MVKSCKKNLVPVWSQFGPSLVPVWSQFGPSLVPVFSHHIDEKLFKNGEENMDESWGNQNPLLKPLPRKPQPFLIYPN